jgi:hypothetical protein
MNQGIILASMRGELGALFWLVMGIVAFVLAAAAFAYYLHERRARPDDDDDDAANDGDDFDDLLHDLRSRKRQT